MVSVDPLTLIAGLFISSDRAGVVLSEVYSRTLPVPFWICSEKLRLIFCPTTTAVAPLLGLLVSRDGPVVSAFTNTVRLPESLLPPNNSGALLLLSMRL